GGERYAVRLVRGYRHDVAEARESLQAELDERPRDGQSADGRARLSRAVRRAEEGQLRAARAGDLRTRGSNHREEGGTADGGDGAFFHRFGPRKRCWAGNDAGSSFA